jgi:hypothetical protein
MYAKMEETIRVSLRIPVEIHRYIKESCTRIKIDEDGKQVIRKLSLTEAYVDFLWRGIGTAKDTNKESAPR